MAGETFTGWVRKGQFIPDDPVRHAGRMARLEGHRVRAAYRKQSLQRTMSQNKYYWGVVVEVLSEWSGYEPEEVHDLMKERFLAPREVELPDGLKSALYPSTRALTIEQFSSYVNRVAEWAAKQGCHIPEAHEVLDA